MPYTIEMSNILNDSKVYPSSVYGIEMGKEYRFTDLRTTVNTDILCAPADLDFSEKEISCKERLYRYQLADCKKFELDFCKSSRKKYSFKIISDLYFVLWGIESDDNLIDSSETIISPKQNIVRALPELRKKQRGRPVIDWDLYMKSKNDELEEFSYRVATMGNFMPVPSCEQIVLNTYFRERFDVLLSEIKKYYEEEKKHISFTNKFVIWLESFVGDNGNKKWLNFVDKNYLKGSFIDEKYDVIEYDGTLSQLSKMIYKRSVVMIQEYVKRTE